VMEQIDGAFSWSALRCINARGERDGDDKLITTSTLLTISGLYVPSRRLRM
jgi:hypothetical protein